MKKQHALLLLCLLLLIAITGQTIAPRLLASTARVNEVDLASSLQQAQQPDAPPVAAYLTGPNAGESRAIALNYLQQNRAKLGLTEADFADIVITDQYTTQHNGVTHLYLRQRYHGIEVYKGDININISRNGEVINLGNHFIANLAGVVNTDTPQLSPSEAVGYAAQKLGLTITAPLQIAEAGRGPARAMQLTGDGISTDPIPVKLMYQRQLRGDVRLVWSALIRPPDGDHWWHSRVDAVTGEVLDQNDWVVHEQWGTNRAAAQPSAPVSAPVDDVAVQPASPLTPPTYRVFALPLESPHDGPGLPSSHTLLNNPANTVASPYGWHDIDGTPGHEFNDTRGNNVFAQEDVDANDIGGFRPTGKNANNFNFDYTFNPAQGPFAGSNQPAEIVNLFYWNNIIHDVFYQYGFDEASGNFQENNYDQTGLGHDAVQADAQDGSGTNNANFATPPDGQQPRMQMFIFDLTNPNRDGDLDNGIIIHEYGHGISNRLTGGPANVECLNNAEQMGEGWSDWFALAMTAKANDTGPQARAMGTYVLGEPADGPGIRPFPYSTNMTVNPQTYNFIKLHPEVHAVGTVWTAMLWEMYWALRDKQGFSPDLYNGTGGNNLALLLAIDGLKLQTCSPGFVDGRNAILLADQLNTGGANQCTIWQAFAKRGLGFSAEQGSSDSTTDGKEAFDLPTACLDELALTKRADPTIAEAGRVLTYTLVAGNYLSSTLTGVTLADSVPASTTYVAGSASDGGDALGGVVSWPAVTLNPDQAVTRTFQVLVDRTIPEPTTVFSDNLESGGANWTSTGLWHLQQDADPCGNSFSPVTSWYYGQAPACTYETGAATAGQVTSAAPIALPADKQIALTFKSWEKTEDFGGVDTRTLLISTDGTNFEPLWSSTDESGAWYDAAVDLSAYAGQNIWLQFAFDSIDEQFNAFPGWYIDDIQVTAAALIVNIATVNSTEGATDTVTVRTAVVKVPLIEVGPTSFEETVTGGAIFTRTLTIRNTGTAPLLFRLIEVDTSNLAATATAAVLSTLTPAGVTQAPTAPAQPARSYGGDHLLPRAKQAYPPKLGGLTSALAVKVLLLAAADVTQIQALLQAYPDTNQVDIFDGRLSTPTSLQLSAYATVVVISGFAFADPVAVGNVLADYIDDGGTVVQTVPTFFDPEGVGWGLQGRFISDGYSPFSGTGDWFALASLGEFDPLHPIMQGVTEASDSLRQKVDVTPGATVVAHWTDDEFVATKGNVVALNTYLTDSFAWTGDVGLIVHNSIVWLQEQGGADVPWLAEEPVSGTVAVDSVQNIILTFDTTSAAITAAGDYSATLRVRSNDLHNPLVSIPITLHVNGPALTISNTQTYFGRPVTVPLLFNRNGIDVAAMAFTVDFDETCLRFNPADADRDGIPDAITFNVPAGFTLVAHADLSHQAGELNFFIADTTPPLTSLPDGLLANITMTAHCRPPSTDAVLAAVSFATTPPASFSSVDATNVLGKVVGGTVTIQPATPGDCNRDTAVNAADGIANVLEIFDGDGDFWLDAPGGAFNGNPQGCDANADTQINAADIICTVLIIFNEPDACTSAIGAASSAAPAATLQLADTITAKPGENVVIPIIFTGNGNQVAAATFAISLDNPALSFDPSDNNGDGMPDAVSFQLPAGFVTTARYDAEHKQLQFSLADLSVPLSTLPDGQLATIALHVNGLDSGQTTKVAVAFATTQRASLGNDHGQSAPVVTADGAVTIITDDGAEQINKLYLPVVTH